MNAPAEARRNGAIFGARLRTSFAAAVASLVAGTGCALAGAAGADWDLTETMVIAAVWAAIILVAVLAAGRRGLLAMWVLTGALWVPFAINGRYHNAPWYLRLLLQAPDGFTSWSVLAIPLAAAAVFHLRGASASSLRPTPIAIGAVVWAALFGISSWIAGHAPDVGGGPRHTLVVGYGFGTVWLLWPLLVIGWHLRRAHAR